MKLMRNMFATHTDYADLKGAIPTNPAFVPSNVDGICERKGKFLIMEWKRPNEKVSEGQKYLLKALASKDDFMVVIIYGNTDNSMVIDKYFLVQKDGSCMLAGQGLEMFKGFYRQWYELADGN
jgi:hypothetical protein